MRTQPASVFHFANDKLMAFVEDVLPTPAFDNHADLLCDLTVCRAVDAFSCYLTDLALLVFKTQPSCLLAGEQSDDLRKVRLDTIIDVYKQGGSLQDILEAQAEHKVVQLGYKSFHELDSFWTQKLKLPLFTSDEDRNNAVNMFEERNLVVHNRGIVNAIFIDKVRSYPRKPSIGDPLALNFDRLLEILSLTQKAVDNVDPQASAKWHLPTVSA